MALPSLFFLFAVESAVGLRRIGGSAPLADAAMKPQGARRRRVCGVSRRHATDLRLNPVARCGGGCPTSRTPNRRGAGELRPNRSATTGRSSPEGPELAYTISAARENEKMESERVSSLIAIAKARVWASEGWRVVITDADGREYRPAQFDDLSPFTRAPPPKPAAVDAAPADALTPG